MHRIAIVLLLSTILAGPSYAQSCTTQTMSKGGKQLAGAAKKSFIKRCCEDAAVSKDGKPLSGAAKTSYVKKCIAGG